MSVEHLEELQERWLRFWLGESLDRPIIRVTAPSGQPVQRPVPADAEDWFLGVETNLARIDTTLEGTWFGGEALPFVFFNAGWVATSYTSTPRFHERTIWFDPVPIDEALHALAFDPQNPWFRRFEAFHGAMLRRAGADAFMMGQIGLLPASDMLSMLMGTDEFLMALIERPEWVSAALDRMGENWRWVIGHFFERARQVNRFWYGPSWNAFWGPSRFIASQSDVSCMISPEMFQQFILPDLDRAIRAFGPMWYHLDGPGALVHLDSLLAHEGVRVIQWVPGEGAAPHGPAWAEVYRRVQASGRALDLYIPDLRDAEWVIRHMDPSRLALRVVCRSVDEGRQFLEDARRWCAVGRR